MSDTYKIIRFMFRNGSQHPQSTKRTILTGLTLEQAQAHTSSPEASSRTCQKAANRRRTKLYGPWFEGHTKE